MREVVCLECGSRFWVSEEAPDSALCFDCEENAGSSSRKPAKPGRRRPASQPGPAAPRTILWAALGLIALLGAGLALWIWGFGQKRQGRATFVDRLVEPLSWNVPFGGTPDNRALPTGTLPKEFFDRPRDLVAVGPGVQYLVYRPEVSLTQGRFDRDPSQLIEKERDLGRDVRVGYTPPRWTFAAAVAADGRVAVQGREEVVVWDPESDTAKFAIPLRVPLKGMPDEEDGAELRKVWVGWADGRVLFLDGGQLVAFDPARKDRIFAAGANYQRPAVVAPNGKWAILSVGRKFLEVADTATGDCLGRFGGRGDWQQLELSPDGKKLAMLCVKGRLTTDVTTWVADLGTGKLERVQYGYPVERIGWLDAQRLILSTHRGGFIHDFAQGRVLYNLHGGDLLKGYKYQPIEAAGLWWNSGRLPLLLERESDGRFEFREAVPQYPTLDVVFGPGIDQPIQVQVESTHQGLRNTVSSALEHSLRDQRYRIGPGGWKVSITGGIVSVGAVQRQFKWGGITNHPIPGFAGELRLIDPAGAVVQKRPVGDAFPLDPRDDFYDDLKLLPWHSAQGTLNYNEYMLDVVAELTAASVVAESWPPTVVRTKEGLRALPIVIAPRSEPVRPAQAVQVAAGLPANPQPPPAQGTPTHPIPPGAFPPIKVPVNPLRQALDDMKQADARRLAGAQAVAKILPNARHRAEVVAAIEPLLVDPEAGVAAAYALERWATPDVVPAVVAGLKSGDARVRAALIRLLGQLNPEAAIPALAERLANAEDRSEAASALRAIGPKAAPAVRKRLGSDDPATRREAAGLIREFGAEDADARRTFALAAVRGTDQAEVVAALGQLAMGPAVDDSRDAVMAAVRPLVKSPDLLSRRTAVKVVDTWGTDERVPLLIEALDDPDRNIQWVAVEALGKTADARAVMALVRKLESPQLGGLASNALARLKPLPRDVETEVIGALTSPEPEARKAACDLLRMSGTAASVPALQKATGDPNPTVASAARGALHTIDPSASFASPSAKPKAKMTPRKKR